MSVREKTKAAGDFSFLFILQRNAKAVEDSVMNYITAAPGMSDVWWGGNPLMIF